MTAPGIPTVRGREEVKATPLASPSPGEGRGPEKGPPHAHPRPHGRSAPARVRARNIATSGNKEAEVDTPQDGEEVQDAGEVQVSAPVKVRGRAAIAAVPYPAGVAPGRWTAVALALVLL